MHPETEKCWLAYNGKSGAQMIAKGLLSPAQYEVDRKISEVALRVARHELTHPHRQGENFIWPESAKMPCDSMVLVVNHHDRAGHVHWLQRDQGRVLVWSFEPSGKALCLGGFVPGTDRLFRNRHAIRDTWTELNNDCWLLFVAMILSLIVEHRRVDVADVDPNRQTRKRQEGLTGQPAAAWFRVSWTLGKAVRAKGGNRKSDVTKVALHWCRAHWRICKPTARGATWHADRGGWYTWVKDCWRGHPDNGIRLHHYEPRFMDDLRPQGRANAPHRSSLAALDAAKAEALLLAGFAA